MGNGWVWGMAVGWVWMLLVLAVIVWAVLRLTERGGRREVRGPGEPSAQEILDRRYAGGELSDAQYEAMRHHLVPPSSA
jgi:uncharacterized membrane protein